MKKFLFFLFITNAHITNAQTSQHKISVIAYYAGDTSAIDAYSIEKLTHIIFSFCHLKDNKLNVSNFRDTLTIQHLVSLKKRNLDLKVILSIGGWGGCATCSQVFSTSKGRTQFARSTKRLTRYFKTDGIDIDWEYPAIAGFPNHQFIPADKDDFTALVKILRKKLGNQKEISFAAGGFAKFLDSSVDWKAIAPLVDKVNLMSYDLVNGNSIVTGHHTPLYSTKKQLESTDNAIRFFNSIHFPLNKVVIGAAMYGRLFNVNADTLNGLYQSGGFDHGISFRNLYLDSMQQQGYVYYWDDEAKAPYLYNKTIKKIFSYDNERSIALKTKYVVDKKLNGIMFWQLRDDKPVNGLLNVIDSTLHQNNLKH